MLEITMMILQKKVVPRAISKKTQIFNQILPDSQKNQQNKIFISEKCTH